MTTITNEYPDLPAAITTLEKLTVTAARRILDLQQNIEINSSGLTIISISTDETADTVSISLTVGCKFIHGKLEVENPFPDAVFTLPEETKLFPFNGTHLVEAYVYLVLYQSSIELLTTKNPSAEAVYCSYSIESNGDVGSKFPAEISVEQNEVPLTITTNSDGSQSSFGKEYLL